MAKFVVGGTFAFWLESLTLVTPLLSQCSGLLKKFNLRWSEIMSVKMYLNSNISDWSVLISGLLAVNNRMMEHMLLKYQYQMKDGEHSCYRYVYIWCHTVYLLLPLFQVTFPGPRSDTVFEFTTQVNIVPDVFPFADCHGEACLGTLVWNNSSWFAVCLWFSILHYFVCPAAPLYRRDYAHAQCVPWTNSIPYSRCPRSVPGMRLEGFVSISDHKYEHVHLKFIVENIQVLIASLVLGS